MRSYGSTDTVRIYIQSVWSMHPTTVTAVAVSTPFGLLIYLVCYNSRNIERGLNSPIPKGSFTKTRSPGLTASFGVTCPLSPSRPFPTDTTCKTSTHRPAGHRKNKRTVEKRNDASYTSSRWCSRLIPSPQ